jgi:hypothetical protein
MMHGHEKLDSAIVAVKRAKQSGAIRCGAGGAKGGDQGECGSAQHALDTEPHKRVTGDGLHTASYSCRRYPRWEPYAGKPHVRI